MNKFICVFAVFGMMFSASAYAANERTGFYTGGNVGISQPELSGNDTLAVGGINGGYDFGMVRLELDATRLFDGATRNGDVSVNTVSVLGILEHDVNLGTVVVTPFVGVGVGAADFARSDAVSGSRDGVVYTGTAGVSVPLSTNWDGVAAYRYVTTDVKVLENGGDRNTQWNAHVGTVGVRYRF